MGTYAKDTEVSEGRSLSEIRRTLKRYGAGDFAYLERDDMASIAFTVGNRHVRFVITFPDPDSREFTLTPTGKPRTPTAADAAFEQAVRQRWRGLALVVKAKLEAVEAGIASFEQEFLAYLVIDGGQTVYDKIGDDVARAIETGRPPQLQIEG